MRLVDADEIRKKAVPHTRGEHGYNANIRKWAVLVGDIDDAPTIDAVPVIRCQNCKRCDGFSLADIQPNEIGICKINMMEVKPTDFCSYGERKE